MIIGLNTINILLVEDEPIIAMIAKKQLEEKNYIVHIVNSGEKAVNTIVDASCPVDLILMDIDLGIGIDGTEAAKQILDLKDIPVVFLSSHMEPAIVEKTEKITSYGYVVKNSGAVVLDASIKMAIKLFNAKVERKRAENELADQKDRLDHILQGTNVGTWEWNVQTGETVYNCRWAEIIGYTLDEISPVSIETWRRFCHPDDLKESERLSQLCFDKESEYYHCEYRMKHKNGSWVWVLDRGKVATWTEDGRPEWMFGTHQDITDRMQAENTLRESEERFRAFMDNSPFIAWAKDEMGRHVYHNRIFDERFNLGPNDWQGKTDAELWPKEIADTFRENDLAVLNAGHAIELIEETDNPDSSRCIWLSIKFPYMDTGGHEQVGGIAIDITGHKLAEKKLQESEERYRNLFSSINEGFACYRGLRDQDGRLCDIMVLEINAIGAELSGKSREEQIGKKWSELWQNIPDSLFDSYRTLDANNEPLTFEHLSPITNRWYVSRATKISKDIFVVTFADITERKRNEEEILKQLNAKEILLKEIHHRIKNNIANIEGLLCLQADSHPNPEVRFALEDAVSRIRSMRLLYEKLLMGGEYREVSIKKYIESLIDSIIPVFGGNGKINIEQNIADFSLPVKQTISVGIILNELLTNAFKYAFSGRECGHILISLQKTENTATLTVHDNGSGINVTSDTDEPSSFGLILVSMLTEQLNGSFRKQNDNGTKCVLSFKI